MKVARVEEMRDLDRAAVKEFGIIEDLLMENAGEAAYFVIHNEFGIQGKSFVVFCGIGNNGGDGLVVARKIHSMGGEVKVFLMGDSSKFKGPANKNYAIVSKLPIDIKRVDQIRTTQASVSRCDAIVDALFGTGLVRDVEGLYQEAIHLINRSGKTVFSIDIPSGINGETGQVMGSAVFADFTITFGLPKLGNMLYPGYEHCGDLYVTHISFPPALYERASMKIAVNQPSPLPWRTEYGHKGAFGDALFIAGAASYFGAPYFSALSFLKSGAGYSRLAAPRSVIPSIAGKGSEIVFFPQEETSAGSLALSCEKPLLELTERVDIVILGPGLSLHEETQELVRRLAGAITKPLLVDGDGITALCQSMDIVKRRSAPTFLTPHLGEMSRMMNRPISWIEERKVDLLQDQARELGAVIVLKGAHSLIGFPDGRVFINMSGNSGMATAGSGDVLTGTIAGMFGQGLPLEDAVRTGVFMHGFAGDLAADELGEDGMTAQDILDYLPRAVQIYREDYDDVVRDCYGSLFLV